MEPLFELQLERTEKGARDGAATLYRQLRTAILEGRLVAGSKLPPTRQASVHFGLSRNTAIEVYERLLHEGLAVARQGSGTFVAQIARGVRDSPRFSTRDEIDERVNPFWLSEDAERWTGYWQLPDDMSAIGTQAIDLRPALVDPRHFPFDRLRRSFTLKLRHMARNPAGHRAPKGNQGNHQLRCAIAEHLAVTRAIASTPDDILVTAGAQQAFDLIARALVRSGRTIVAVEDPGYPPMRTPFAAAGAAITAVPVDREGVRVDLIPPEAGIVCITPSHQFPLGVPLSAARRIELLRFARTSGAVIVEDDYDGEYRFDGAPVAAMRAGDVADVVFYVGTFSKSMLPALRLGYLVPPRWALPTLIAAKNALDWHSSSLLQSGVAAFMAQGHLTRHIAGMRHLYGERRRVVLETVAQNFPSDLYVLPSYYGIHVALLSEERRDMERVAGQAAAAGVWVHSLARYHLSEERMRGLVIGFGSADADELRRSLDKIGLICRANE